MHTLLFFLYIIRRKRRFLFTFVKPKKVYLFINKFEKQTQNFTHFVNETNNNFSYHFKYYYSIKTSKSKNEMSIKLTSKEVILKTTKQQIIVILYRIYYIKSSGVYFLYQMNCYKIVMLGSGSVGKSAITVQFISGAFIAVYDPTIEDFYRTSVIIKNESILIDVVDTAGQDEYKSLRDQYMQTGDGFVVVYSISSENSFIEANKIYQSLFTLANKDINKDHIPIVLCGNKCDLHIKERQISIEQGASLAESLGTLFFETSAKLGINVKEAFTSLVQDIRAHLPNPNVQMLNETKSKSSRQRKFRCNLF
ncbi:hypothetical protein EIN_164320 [Entamoeba invadens IP1]|uniref:small monomeric GTPase n=1 Tax=Entamoeba invadens IP1 TaxID=370355 RepID=A0A0A1U484_ENTIV|nr:hypothetical protein EIN_164320 [Entamoeba invadens IP1]ELP89032.1 hypothetical protein EIN_164320 [Entamoeba invadens IP1]|eukprot:XP_004255803.1 hypothetical protein EIN_164320 [Entamoeba invadens IP1]